MIAKDMKDVDWDGQTKSSITSPTSKMKEYFKTDFEKFSQKILKSDDIMLPITELFTLRAKAKENAELKKLKKTKKKIKSEKYLPATKNRKILFLCEGASAVGGLMPSLGRENYGYFEMRGVPLNAYDSTQAKFTQNKELSELFQIIQNEDYEYIAFANDQDLDGFHIKGLLLGFFARYLPDLLSNGTVGELNTPVQIAMKNKKPIRWNYNLGATFELKKGEVGKYMKGLGSYKPELLKHIVDVDGISNMIKIFNLDNDAILDDWLNSEKSDTRKDYISKNVFDITGI
jgi:topoisomerase-4 subunit B